MELLKSILVVILLSMQYLMSIIFRSDIPMNIKSGDIICIVVVSFLIQLIVIFVNRNYKFLFTAFLLFFIIWLIDTVHLLTFIGEKNYVLNIMGIYTIIISSIYYIYKIKINNTI